MTEPRRYKALLDDGRRIELIGVRPSNGSTYMPVPRCDTCQWWAGSPPELAPMKIGGIVDRLIDEGGEPVKELFKTLDLQPLGDCRLFECQEGEQVEHTSMV